MTNIQRKYMVVSSPLLFSLCCLSPLSSHAISFQDILAQSEQPPLFLLEQDTTLFNNPFTAKEEAAPILWQTASLLFPILPELATTIQEELRLSNVPIYLSYLDYILLQEKRHQHAISLSLLPQGFYRNLLSNSSQISIETTLKAPLPLIRPLEECSLLEELLEASAVHPTDLNSLDSTAALTTSNFQYAPTIQRAPSLTIEKQILPRGKLLSLHASSIKHTSPSILSEIPFVRQVTQPSSEHAKHVTESLPHSSARYPLLGESPSTLHEFNTIEMLSPMGDFVPASPVSVSDTIPLSYNCSQIPPLNILFTSHMMPEQRSSITSPHAAKESVDLTIKSNPTPLALKEAPDSSTPAFSLHAQDPLCKEISHPSILEHARLPKTSRLQLPAATITYPLCVTEKHPVHYLSPSLEPYVQSRFSRSVFVPGIGGTYIGSSLSFNNVAYSSLSPRYVHSLPVQKEPIFMRADPYASDALVSYITSHTQMPHVSCIPLIRPDLALLNPKTHDAPLLTTLSLQTPTFKHLLESSSDSSMRFDTLGFNGTYPLYERQESSVKYPSDELVYGRMPSPHLMDALENIQLHGLPLYIEGSFIGTVVPKTEHSTFSTTTDYPFLQEFYIQAPAHAHPFLFSYAWLGSSLSSTSLIDYDKFACDPSATLSGALSLLESLGNRQVIDSTCHPNTELLSNIIPDHESTDSSSIALLETPDPFYFTVSYTRLNSPVAFPTSSLIGTLRYTNTLSLDTAKKTLPTPESLLSSELEALHQDYSCSMTHDLPDIYTPLTPHSESSNFLAYSNLYQAKLNHYSITTDKNTLLQSKIPQLLADAHLSPALVTPTIDLSPSRKNAALLNQSSRSIQDNLISFPTLQDLRTLSLSEEFSVDVQIAQNTKGSGYLFSITLEPTLKELAVGSPQNFIFLVDRSSSIEKNRFQIFKQAINKALPYLKENDTFNVLSFDTEISKMSHDSVYVSSATKHGARRFLESQKRGYKYVLPNLYSILLHVHAMVKESPIPTTVVLLTNGKSLENFNIQDERLAQLISTNQSGFTLFTACSSQNNNTLMLEILSNLNRGEFMHSQTNAAFPRKLAAFVKHAGSLLAKDIHVSAAKADPNLKIEFFPNTALAPNLYGDRPYTIVGKMDQLSDFDLILQGRFCDNWLNVTKKISFKTARHGGHSIYKDYTMHVAYNKYREFLQEGNTASLDEAKKFLYPFNTNFPY